jgi:type VI protein secretion system component VasK
MKLMKVVYTRMLAICVFVFFPAISHAYVGPGTGLSAIGTIIAFIGAVFLLVMGFLWYPIKRLLKGKQVESSREIRNENSNVEPPVEKTDKNIQ